MSQCFEYHIFWKKHPRKVDPNYFSILGGVKLLQLFPIPACYWDMWFWAKKLSSKILIFEKNPFTTAVSIPKSFHMAQKALCSEIHQPALILHTNASVEVERDKGLNTWTFIERSSKTIIFMAKKRKVSFFNETWCQKKSPIACFWA